MKQIFTMLIFLASSLLVKSQIAGTPTFINLATPTQLDQQVPLFLTGSNDCQWIYAPGSFHKGGVSTGKKAILEKITKVYFQLGPILYTSTSYTNFTIRLGQPKSLEKADKFVSQKWASGLSTVYNQANYTITGVNAGDFIEVPLQTPFYYDPSKALVVEMYIVSGFGNSLRHNTGTSFQRLYGAAVNSGVPTIATGQLRFGFSYEEKGMNNIGVVSIDSPFVACNPIENIVAKIQNFGKNRIDSFRVNWSVNGITKPSIYVNSNSLDTFDGPGNSSISVNLGSTPISFTSTKIKVWTSHPNGQVDSVKWNDTIIITKKLAMAGTYTINPSGSGNTNFVSFQSAINAMETSGICGPIKFVVSPGKYSTPITLQGIDGASLINTITFDGLDKNVCLIEAQAPKSYVLNINNGSYITFKNFTINNLAGSESCSGISITGNSKTIRITNNKIIVPNQVGTVYNAFGVIVSGSEIGLLSIPMLSDSIWIDSNEFIGGNNSINFSGNSNSLHNKDIRIFRNNIKWCNGTGITVSNVYNPLQISYNNISMLGYQSGVYGINSSSNQNADLLNSSQINFNKINGFNGYGIYVTNPVLNSNTAPLLIYGNDINSSKFTNTTACNGIFVNAITSARIKVFHNSVVMNGTANVAKSSCFYSTGTYYVEVKNNVFATVGGTFVPAYFNTNPFGNVINYNLYYNGSNPTTGTLVFRGSALSPASYKTQSGGGDSSYNSKPNFVSNPAILGDLHLKDNCNGQGLNLKSDVPLDMEGDTFSVSPSLGAYQFKNISYNNLTVTRILTNSFPLVLGNQDLSFEVKNIGLNTINSYSAGYKNNNGTPVTITKIKTLNNCALDTVTFSASNQINIVAKNAIICYTGMPNNLPDGFRENDTLKSTIWTSLNGVYSVGGVNPDFKTPFDAIEALKYGVSGPVTFEIRPGNYTERLIINGQILGSSKTNRVIFKGINKDSVILSGDETGGIILVNQSSNITFRDLTIRNNNLMGSGIAVIGNTLTYNISGIQIVNNRIVLPRILSGIHTFGRGIVFSGSDDGPTIAATGADSCIIDSNYITGGAYGIVMNGCSNSLYNRGILLRGNYIENSNFAGIYLAFIYNPILIKENYVHVLGQNYGFYGISSFNNLSSNTSLAHEISYNKVYNFGGTGIYFYNSVANATTAIPKIFNNVIIGTKIGKDYQGTYGINIGNVSSLCPTRVYHNTVIMNGTTVVSPNSAFYSSGSTEVFVKNNIFITYNGSYYPAYFASNPTAGKVDNNIYYNGANPTSGNLLFRGSNFTAANYKSVAGGGLASFNIIPSFISENDLRVNNNCFAGTNLSSEVPDDLLKISRSITPTIGAYEYKVTGIDLAVLDAYMPQKPVLRGLNTLKVKIHNIGTSAVTSFNLNYKLNNDSVISLTYNGNLLPCDTLWLDFNGVLSLNINQEFNKLKIFTSNPNAALDSNLINDTISIQVLSVLKGDYIVGPAPSDFLNFNEALNALQNNGADGKVVFKVKSGIYNEYLYFTSYPGSTVPTTSIEFRSLANHVDSVKLQFNANGLTNNPYTVVNFTNGASRISFKYLTIQNNATGITGNINCVEFTGALSFDTIQNCKIQMQPYDVETNNYTSNYLVIGIITNGNGLAFINNTFYGAHYGVSIIGQFGNYISNLVMANNTFIDNRFTPIAGLTNIKSLKFINNRIFIYSNVASLFNSLSFSGLDSSFNFSNNFIQTNGSNCNISFSSLVTTPTRRGFIANNIVCGSSNTTFRIDNPNYLDIYNNSFNLNSGYFYFSNSSSIYDVKFRNNIINGTGSYCLRFFSSPSGLISDYNNIYTSGSNTPVFYNSLRTFLNYKTTYNKDKNSISYRPGFTSDYDLTPNSQDSAVWSINGRGIQLPEVSTDYLGNPRPTTILQGVPDLGAYEVIPTSTPPACTAIPANPIAGSSQVFLFGLDTVAKINWDANTIPPNSVVARAYSGEIPPSIAPANKYMFYYSDISAPAGNYLYNLELYMKPNWLGSVGSYSDLKLAKFSTGSGWIVYTNNGSSTDSIRGRIIASGLTSFSKFTGANNSFPLPVQLSYFKARKSDESAVLRWNTASEKNSFGFEIERSINAVDFEKIAFVKSSGNSNKLIEYDFIDVNVFQTNTKTFYYRLKMIDFDGTYTYSKIEKVHAEETQDENKLKVYPNPFNSSLVLENVPIGTNKIILKDLNGKTILESDFNDSSSFGLIEFHQQLKSGIYILTTLGSEINHVKIVKE